MAIKNPLYLIIPLLFFFHSSISFGQVQTQKIDSLFQSSSLTGLNRKIKEVQKDKSSTIGNIWIKRELNSKLNSTVEYHQIRFDLIIPVREYWGQKAYILEVLSSKNQLIFKRLKDKDGHTVMFQHIKSSMDSFIKNHEKSFNTVVLGEMEEIKLFENDHFGSLCYFGGEMPEKCKEMMNMVNETSTPELVKWMKSLSPLSQAYGVLGLYILEKQGIKLSEDTKELISFIKQKTIKIMTCEGCIVTYQAMNQVLSDEYLNLTYKSLRQ